MSDDAPAPTAFDWHPPVRWKCLRCDEIFTTRELMPRCPCCGFAEAE